MAQFLREWFFLLMMVHVSSCTFGYSAIEIVNSSCNEEKQNCRTLAECLNNSTSCFMSYTTLNFTSKKYEIRSEWNIFVISNITSLEMVGNNALIHCVSNTAFAFINVANLRIYGLNFSMCGTMLPERVHQMAFHKNEIGSSFFMRTGTKMAILLLNGYNINFTKVKVSDSSGYGLVTVDIMGLTISYSEFSYNNYRSLDCYSDKYVNSQCCGDISLSNSDRDSNCTGGNLVIILQNGVQSHSPRITKTVISHTSITNGVNLDTQLRFDANYTYAAGGLSIFLGHTEYSSSVRVIHCKIMSNIGHSGANAVIYMHDHLGSNYSVTINSSKFLGGNTHFPYFSNSAKSGGLTIVYGHVDEKKKMDIHQSVSKNIRILDSEFRNNEAFTASGILVDTYIARDKRIFASMILRDCTISDNSGYDSIFSILGTEGNRQYDVRIELHNTSIINNTLLPHPQLNHPLISYMHQPHISSLHIEYIGIVRCYKCKIKHNQLRGISALKVISLIFNGTNMIVGNTGIDGGALKLDLVLMELSHSTGATVQIADNMATLSGGAFFITEPRLDLIKKPHCFFNLDINPCDSDLSMGGFILRNNSAAISGNSIFGGSLDTCVVRGCIGRPQPQSGLSTFMEIFDVPWNRSLTEVTSEVRFLCFCVNGVPQCGLDQWEVYAYPGERVYIPAVAVGQLNGTTPSVIRSVLSNMKVARLIEAESTQQLDVVCNHLNFTIHGQEEKEFEISLSVNPQSTTDRKVVVSTRRCPEGFVLDESLMCSCTGFLKDRGVSCFLEHLLFQAPASVWIGYRKYSREFLAHNNCPLHKCKSATTTFYLNNTNSQCMTGFSGTLCGRCIKGLSVVFGSNYCKRCSNLYSILVTVIFVTGGLMLVVAMLCGDLTVSKGTFNSVLWYANIVHIHRSIFFPPNSINAVTVLISWLNLDLGIEMCFYNGMDAYSRIWLQYLFPIYVIFLALLLSLFSQYSTIGAKFVGRNITAVIATLVLLSYTKVLRIVAEILSFTSISSSLGSTNKVWLYDGNIPYMSGKHAILSVIATLLLVLLIIPFTLLILFEYPLSVLKKTRRIFLRMKLSFITSIYQKPYKKSFRWWTGMMLLARCLFVLIYQLNILGNQRLNLLIIASLGIAVLGIMWNLGGLYHNRFITMIEAFYMSNLLLLVGWNEYVIGSGNEQRDQAIVSYILISLALLVFIALIVYYLGMKIAIIVKRKRKTSNENNIIETNIPAPHDLTKDFPSTTYIAVTDKSKPLTKIG